VSTATRHMTVDEFYHAAHALGRCELIEGEVRHLSLEGMSHGRLTARLHFFIADHVAQRGLGEVFAAGTGFVLDAKKHTVRAPDIGFISQDRMAAAETPEFCPIHPDLCAEVLSPDDQAGEIQEKVQAWLDFGTPLVWVVDPRTQTVTAHEPGGHARVYQKHESLPGGPVLPGFDLPLEKLFS
jgi:Uma2 family endonuclease